MAIDPQLSAIISLVKARRGEIPNVPTGAPVPYAPTTNLDSLKDDTSLAFAAQNPEPVPPKFVSPAGPDMNFVNQYAGPEPTRPILRDPGLLEKIGTVLSGVGAGFEGRGGEYAESVRRQRNAPLVQYERDRERFEDRRTRAIELAERRAERQAEQENRANELAYERDFKVWLSKNNDRSDEAKLRMQQAFAAQRDAKQAQLEEEREQRRELRARQDDARGIAARYGTGPGAAPPAVAKEIGEYIANIRGELSPLAARWWNAQARRTGVSPTRAGGPSKAAQALVDRFYQLRQAREAALQRGDAKAAQAFKEAENRAFKSGARFPGDIEIGETIPDWKYMKMRGQQSAPAATPGAQPQPQADPLGIR